MSFQLLDYTTSNTYNFGQPLRRAVINIGHRRRAKVSKVFRRLNVRNLNVKSSMPEFLTTRGITAKIENIISDSKANLFLVSPYLSFIPDSILIRIKEALERGVKVSLIFRDKERIHQNEIDKLKLLIGIDLFYNPNLHAKAFFNEKEAVVTSFNLSGYSEANNIEFGIYFTKIDSSDIYEKLAYESRMILRTSKLVKFDNKYYSLEELTQGIFDTSGYCIRCKNQIDFNYKKPFCKDCYDIWKNYNNPAFKENYCHFCGMDEITTINQPICKSCYEQLESIVETSK